mmetsp:Transcript_50321/g.93036  ORF Transcript_50321/g.93036 Transcript_50321/m.93036 type:complete len:324 (-) Transcript_50321:159-1130(-)
MAELAAIQPMGVHAGPDFRPDFDWGECRETLMWFTAANIGFVVAAWCVILHSEDTFRSDKRRRQPTYRLLVSWWLPVMVFVLAVVFGVLRNDHPTCERPKKVNYIIIPEGISLSINFWISRYGDFTGPLLLVFLRLVSYLMRCRSLGQAGKDFIDGLLSFVHPERIYAFIRLPVIQFMFWIIVWRIVSYLHVRQCHCYISDHLYFVASVLAQVLVVAYEEDMAHQNEVSNEVDGTSKCPSCPPYAFFVYFCCFIIGVLLSIESFVTATHFHTRKADFFGAGLGLLTFVSVAFCHIDVAPQWAERQKSGKGTALVEPLIDGKAP